MVELHWKRRDFREAGEGDIAAIRHALYARRLASTVTADFAGQRRSIEVVDYPASRRAAAERSIREDARRDLARAERTQIAIRELLELDAPDEPEPDDEDAG